MKLLDGQELAEYIKERQAHEVRALRQANHTVPKLAIVRISSETVADSYTKQVQAYGTDILADVETCAVDQTGYQAKIVKLNADPAVHGIMLQIPLTDSSQPDEIINSVVAPKDVDSLAAETRFEPPAVLAINWLLAGYNIELRGKHIVIVDGGRHVGEPLARAWKNSGLDVTQTDRDAEDLSAITRAADVLISAADVPGLINADMIKPDTVVVDAGSVTDENGLVGDVAADVRDLPNIKITPEKGGVGPLAICALFDNVIQAARTTAQEKDA